MEALIKDIFTFLLQHYALYLVVVMSITTTLIITILNYGKKPFKKLTAKIKNEEIRKLINRLFIFAFSFGLSFGFWFLLNWIAPVYFAIDYKEIFINGAMPIVLYAFGEGWISKEKVKSLIFGVVEKTIDGELTKDEAINTVKELNKEIDAEKELNKLLKK